MGDYELPDEVWSQFAAEAWERTPRVMAGAFAGPILTSAELFDALLTAAERYRATKSPARRASQRFAVRHATVMTDVERYLARPDDGSLSRYIDRLDRQLNGEPFELIINEFQEHSRQLWERLCDFVRNLYRHVGLPPQRAEAALFLRKQDTTSFGVHKDDASVFLFPVEGTKRILAWPPEIFASQGTTLTLDYEAFRGSAAVLSAGPGDVTYWPSSHWHVGEAGGELSISINLGLHQEGDARTDLQAALDYVTASVPDDLVFPQYPDDIQERTRELPESLRRTLDAVRDAAFSGRLERALRLVRLNRITGSGFKRLPARSSERVIEDDDVIEVRRAIAWTPWAAGEIACSAEGRSFSVPETAALYALLERLRRGRLYSVRALLDGVTDQEVERAFLRSLLMRLSALGALTVVDQESER